MHFAQPGRPQSATRPHASALASPRRPLSARSHAASPRAVKPALPVLKTAGVLRLLSSMANGLTEENAVLTKSLNSAQERCERLSENVRTHELTNAQAANVRAQRLRQGELLPAWVVGEFEADLKRMEGVKAELVAECSVLAERLRQAEVDHNESKRECELLRARQREMEAENSFLQSELAKMVHARAADELERQALGEELHALRKEREARRAQYEAALSEIVRQEITALLAKVPARIARERAGGGQDDVLSLQHEAAISVAVRQQIVALLERAPERAVREKTGAARAGQDELPGQRAQCRVKILIGVGDA